MQSNPHVVIIGGGFAGLSAARALRRAPAQVTLLDRRNHHVFQPLLYQVATAGLSAPDIAAPIRHILRRQRNARVVMGDVVRIDAGRRAVVLADGESSYDALVLATGATHSYFGHAEWETFAPGLKSLEDALEIRRRLLLAFENAEREADEARRRAFLTFVVVGAGATGVELAGTVAELARHTLRDEFHRIDPGTARVILLEAADRVLPPYLPELSGKARQQLERLGVEVRLGARVTAIDAEGVTVDGGLGAQPRSGVSPQGLAPGFTPGAPAERIEARTVLWGAGVAASPLGASLGVPVDRAGRVEVRPDLSVPGHPEVFVAGDLAHFEQDGAPVPGVAPAAMQMGRHAARNVRRLLRGEATQPFRYRDKGSLATIGRNSAVAQFGRRVKIWGFPAWLAWLGVHIFFLIGFRNRMVVMSDWAVAYFTYQRHARLIFEPREK